MFFVIKYFRFPFISYVKTATPSKKVTPLSQHPSLIIEIPSSHPLLFENLVGGQTPSRKGGGEVHTMWCQLEIRLNACRWSTIAQKQLIIIKHIVWMFWSNPKGGWGFEIFWYSMLLRKQICVSWKHFYFKSICRLFH